MDELTLLWGWGAADPSFLGPSWAESQLFCLSPPCLRPHQPSPHQLGPHLGQPRQDRLQGSVSVDTGTARSLVSTEGSTNLPFPGVEPYHQTINPRQKGCFEGLYLLRGRGLWPYRPLGSWAPGPVILGRRLSQEGNEASLFWGSRKRRWESRGKYLFLRPVRAPVKEHDRFPVALGCMEGVPWQLGGAARLG